MSDLRIITEPCVTVICRPLIDTPNLVRHLDAIQPERDPSCALGYSGAHTSAGDALPEIAGRLCYRSWGKPRPGGNAAYLDHLKEAGHGSPLEHACWSFLISGVSRSLSHEWVRHRVGVAISQVSQRFVDESDVAFVVPPALISDVKAANKYLDWWYGKYLWSCPVDEGIQSILARAKDGEVSGWKISDSVVAGMQWLLSAYHDIKAYRWQVEYLTGTAPVELSGTDRRKWARQAARAVLPNCTETALVWSSNARSIRHVIEMRASAAADLEIRRLAVLLLRIMQEESPAVFSDYRIVPLADGTEAAETKWRKV